MARIFTDYRRQRIMLGEGTYAHIAEVHPEVSLKIIQDALGKPDEVRESSYRSDSELYYLRRTSRRYACVIVKTCRDGIFISTALTTGKPKTGRVVYRKGG